MAASSGLFMKAMIAALGGDDPATRDPRIKLTPNAGGGGGQVEADTDSGGKNATRRADLRGILSGRHMSGGASPTLLTGREGASTRTRKPVLTGQ